MSRPLHEARELSRGFQTRARRAVAEWRASACVTLGLTFATAIAVVTVSIEIVRAAAN